MADDGPRNTGPAGTSGTVTLQEHLMAIIHSIDVRLTERMHDQSTLGEQRALFSERAIDKAASAMEKRLDGMNEFRKSLEDARKDTLQRAEFDAWKKGIEERLAKGELRGSNLDGRFWAFGTAFTILVTILALMLKFVHLTP